MRAIIVIGWKDFTTTAKPELLYCGVDGLAAVNAAAAARESGEFKRIGKLTNPSFTPMPVVPTAKPAVLAAPATEPQRDPEPATELEASEESASDASKAPKAPKAPKAKSK